jgi:hypothetical protein
MIGVAFLFFVAPDGQTDRQTDGHRLLEALLIFDPQYFYRSEHFLFQSGSEDSWFDPPLDFQ